METANGSASDEGERRTRLYGDEEHIVGDHPAAAGIVDRNAFVGDQGRKKSR